MCQMGKHMITLPQNLHLLECITYGYKLSFHILNGIRANVGTGQYNPTERRCLPLVPVNPNIMKTNQSGNHQPIITAM